MCMKRDKEGKGSVSAMCACLSVYSVRICVKESDRQTDTERQRRQKMEGQSGVKEKKVIKSSRIAYFTFTQRLTEWTCSRV